MDRTAAILLEHGSGGRLTHELIERLLVPHFKNPYLERLEDSAVFEADDRRYCFTTDSYVISPIFFPGGDIGSLAVHGTINDLAMAGGRPLFMSCGLIIEEGFMLADLERVVASMGRAAREAGVAIVTGDTKVVPKGAGDGVYINTAGIGSIHYAGRLAADSVRPGDSVILSGTLGDHSAAILSCRQAFGFATTVLSDSAPLHGLVESVLKTSLEVRCLRDATRGGLGAVLAEIAARSGCDILIDEKAIPIKDQVRGICEMFGMDPLFMANEGKMVAVCSPAHAVSVLDAMRAHPLGREAAVIGRVPGRGRGRLVLQTIIGGERVLDLPSGELVPRIC